MTPPNRRSAGARGRGRGDRAGDAKPKPRERNAAKRGSVPSARPARAVTTVQKKLVVRNLPPSATEADALRLLAPLGVDGASVWRFVAGRVRGNQRAPVPARLYLDLKKEPERARKLIAALHGQSFWGDDAKGGRLQDNGEDASSLVVEFAPFQKIPREKQRKDAKVGTIDRDPEYLAFLEELQKPRDVSLSLPSAEAVADMAEGEAVEKPVATLVKYLNERKVHSRDRGKGKAGGKGADKNGARRQMRKKDVGGCSGSKQKTTKDKSKASKERPKKGNADASSSRGGGGAAPLNALWARKTRGGRPSSKKEAGKQEAVQPGMLRIMTPKSGEPGAAPSTEAGAEKRGPKGGKKSNEDGAAGNRARGRGRGAKKPKEGGEAASADGKGGGAAAEAKTRPRRADSRTGAAGGKKEANSRGERARGDPAIKLVLLGNGSVGKSSLISRFVDDGFARVYKQTIGLDFFEKKLQFPRDQRLVLQVWDIGGQTINSKMLAKYLFGAHVALLCYDVTDAQSFSDVEDWLSVARANASQQMALYLVGNKTDLVAHRVISSEKHESFIRDHAMRGGFLVSAQSGDNVLKTVYRISAAAANIRVSEFELSFCDQVVRAVVPAASDAGGGGEQEVRTAMADEIEAEDRANEARKARKKASHQCHIM
ncbi:hypothetical protein BBJ28_00013600 [Nothophytophthora sp. Chile5]|nr:hypothetical protein BBJ28_00013600 [Nothophytophthora sp. Chile5]